MSQVLILLRVDPAASERITLTKEVSVALDLLIGPKHSAAYRAHVHNWLDDRAGRIGTLNSPVHRRMARRTYGIIKVLTHGDGWPGHHGENLASIDIKYHCGAIERRQIAQWHLLRRTVVVPAIVPLLCARESYFWHEERLHAGLQCNVERQL